MRPVFKKVDSSAEEAFVSRVDQFSQFYNKWHFHPELELTHIVKGKGTRFVGDNIEFFQDGDLILVGSNLPHVWKNQNEESEVAIAQVIQFLPEFLGDELRQKVEFKNFQALITKSAFGLKIDGPIKSEILEQMNKLFDSNNALDRFLILLKILDRLGASDGLIPLSKSLFSVKNGKYNSERLNLVIEYTIANFATKVVLDDVASISNMSVSNFCKYFKARMNKTYVEYLTEVRIGMSCKLLIEDKLSVHQIAFECGFINISNFNRSFKLNKQMTPLLYRKLYQL
jgi:AraC-like DNA-binding protein